MPQHPLYVRSANTVEHQWIHLMHIVIHVIQHVMIVDTQEVHLTITHTLAPQVALMDVVQLVQHPTRA